jgi:hypothetical protein
VDITLAREFVQNAVIVMPEKKEDTINDSPVIHRCGGSPQARFNELQGNFIPTAGFGER